MSLWASESNLPYSHRDRAVYLYPCSSAFILSFPFSRLVRTNVNDWLIEYQLKSQSLFQAARPLRHTLRSRLFVFSLFRGAQTPLTVLTTSGSRKRWVAYFFAPILIKKKEGKVQTLVRAPLCRQALPQRRSGTWRAPSSVAHTCLIYLPSHRRYSFTDHERMEGWVNP